MDYQQRREKLVVHNSISNKKEPFKTQEPGTILWYNCGPTVYDSSHMGHARSYISLDIIRRILCRYFGYTIKYVMNITDIDDKIIRKARQLYLFEKYRDCINQEEIQKGITFYEDKLSKETDPDKKDMMIRLLNDCKTIDYEHSSFQEIHQKCKEIICEYLDNKYGSTVEDNESFVSVPRQYESEFFDDMVELNVMDPDILTRVSEYVPQIVEYIEKIIANGYAYVSNQSVYFDTEKFSSSYKYPKLVSAVNNKDLSEGEGVLTAGGDANQDKKHPNDFALWKKSKPGEPSWESPWGKGRPGWHIECSVMASDTLGHSLDIHSGGYDLKFPHHDNEMAQSEAYFNTGDSWVKYFLHTGHLTISGCKMSKSLKNFITIKDALKKHSWRQLRLTFLQHTWNATLDYGDSTMKDAIAYEKSLIEFLLAIKDSLRNEASSLKSSPRDEEFEKRIAETKQAVENALCDNFNTKSALLRVKELTSILHTYLKDNSSPNRKILLDVGKYIFDLMETFGAWEKESILFSNQSLNREKISLPFLKEAAKFEQEMRKIGLDTKNNSILENCDQLKRDLREEEVPVKKSQEELDQAQALPQLSETEIIISLLEKVANFRHRIRQIGLDTNDKFFIEKCDQFREKLTEIGVKLEDIQIAEIMRPKINCLDKEYLLQEIQEKKNQEEAKKLEKERKRKELEAKEAQNAIPPSQLFINQTDKYSQFDDKGMPTHDAEGKPISKSSLKKLLKLYEQQKKRYEEHLLNRPSVKENI